MSGREPVVLAWIAVGTIASYVVAWVIQVPAVVPVLNTLPAFPFMIGPLRAGNTARAIRRMVVWAIVLGACATTISIWQPAMADRLFINGQAYRREMLEWVLTGIGAESSPQQFIPQHLTHAAIFGVLSLVSGSVLSMPMGAILMNYMGRYVGAMVSLSSEPVLTVVVGWHPWSILRILSFVTLGVVLAGPVLGRVGGFRYDLRAQRHWFLLAIAGLGLDILLKWWLAPAWRGLLLNLIS